MIRYGREYTEIVTAFSYIIPTNWLHIEHTKYMAAKTSRYMWEEESSLIPSVVQKELVRMREQDSNTANEVSL